MKKEKRKVGIDYLLLTQVNLALTFTILKLTGVIAWSWLWVLCPLWIGLAGWLFIVSAFLIMYVIADAITKWYADDDLY